MSATLVASPTSRLRFGLGRVDITPPVGIYNRLWGAARQERATGVHRPLTAEVMHLRAVDGSGQPLVRAQLDLCGLAEPVYQRLAGALAEATGVPRDRVSITFSHTHSAGWLSPPERLQMPGGELLGPYLQQLEARLRAAGASAAVSSVEAVVSYQIGRCDLAANRDYWDDARGLRACGFNPEAPADDTATVARVQAVDGRALATLVHYACHPTTLAWQNSLLSPDYVGAMRETVEAATGAPCVFLLGACGELGPRRGFVGDPAVADANGRQLGHAALSALAGLLHVAYLLPRASYGLGLYQEEPSILAPGCLELLADEIAARAGELP